MLALKCDNCGGYFGFGNKDDMNGIYYVHENTDGCISYSKIKHLCPDCMVAVMKALKDRKAKCNSNPIEDDLK